MKNFDNSAKMLNIYTDLALEAREMLKEESNDIDGIRMTIEEGTEKDVKVTIVEILDDEGVSKLNKPIGKYITIESESMKENDVMTHEFISEVLAEKISEVAELDDESTILLVGLGNWNVTPDALGPKVISKVLVTRHMAESGALPLELFGAVRPVCAVSPGVMGTTGIETAEIVRGIVDKVRPDLVIAVDALAARQTSRINSTIQMSDTGVNPGAGMGNKRTSINKNTLGVPVIAIGVPTVVDAATLVNDTMDRMLDAVIAQTDTGSEFYTMLKDLESDEKQELISEILKPYAGNMFVTPKEVDATIERLSSIIANAVNMALHPGIDSTDMNRYL